MVNPLTENLVSYLVLAYNRPNELYACLSSIRKNTKFDHQIIVCANGGIQDYYWDFYNQGLIDKLILRKVNGGLGVGTIELFNNCDTKYAIYHQEDQILGREFAKDELDKIIKLFDNQYIKSISIAGNTNQNMYSERSHVIDVDFYKSLPYLGYGGAGPFANEEWHESLINKYYKKMGFNHYIWPHPLVLDNGCYAVRENPDGSVWQHRTDKKTLKLLRGPVKERFIYPNFTESEWLQVLETQTWPENQIPKNDKKHSFQCWPD